jgi:hypothetical protein
MIEDPGVPLGHYLETSPGVRVALWCNACPSVETFALAAVIAKLDAQGLAGRAVGIRSLAGRIRHPCPRCGQSAWETRPDYPPARMGLGV